MLQCPLEKDNGTLLKDHMQHNMKQDIKYIWQKEEVIHYFTSLPKMGLIGLIRKVAQFLPVSGL